MKLLKTMLLAGLASSVAAIVLTIILRGLGVDYDAHSALVGALIQAVAMPIVI